MSRAWVWKDAGPLPSMQYICGHCSADISSQHGYRAHQEMTNRVGLMYICHRCTKPTLFLDHAVSTEQVPGARFGRVVPDVSDTDVAAIYEEARSATGANAHTAAVMCCRKLLMHLAVARGAATGQSFKQYVDYLETNHYTPPSSKAWVDSIRDKGNEVNHEIKISTREDAELLISFNAPSVPLRISRQGEATPTTGEALSRGWNPRLRRDGDHDANAASRLETSAARPGSTMGCAPWPLRAGTCREGISALSVSCSLILEGH